MFYRTTLFQTSWLYIVWVNDRHCTDIVLTNWGSLLCFFIMLFEGDISETAYNIATDDCLEIHFILSLSWNYIHKYIYGAFQQVQTNFIQRKLSLNYDEKINCGNYSDSCKYDANFNIRSDPNDMLAKYYFFKAVIYVNPQSPYVSYKVAEKEAPYRVLILLSL